MSFNTSVVVQGPRFGVEEEKQVAKHHADGSTTFVENPEPFIRFRAALYDHMGVITKQSERRMIYGEAMEHAYKWSLEYGEHRNG